MRTSLTGIALLIVIVWQIPAFGQYGMDDDFDVGQSLEIPSKQPPRVFWLGASGTANQRILQAIQKEPTKIRFIDTPLEEVVDYLESLHHISIVIDRRALRDADLDIEMPITRSIEGIPLGSALNMLCIENGLGWYVDNHALYISSAEAAKEHTSVRAYELGSLSGEDVIKAIGAVSESLSSVNLWNPKPGGYLPPPFDVTAAQHGIGLIRSSNAIVIRQNREDHELVRSLILSLNGFQQ
ncbi:hypothetical protein GC197_11765 [bacterium]|nr:hypothetical protein [bacterium]